MAKIVSPSDYPNLPISVRPSTPARQQLDQIARELRKSPAGILTDLLIDALEMLESGHFGVPPTVNMLRVLRENKATLEKTAKPVAEQRDKQDVSLYYDIQAGRTSGVCSDTAPETVTIPAGFPYHVDFAVRVCGNSMEPMIHEGDVAVFRRSEVAQDGRIVAALVDGQMMLKLYKAANGGPAQLVSLNSEYDPIRCTNEVRIQGIYEGKLPLPEKKPKVRVRTAAAR